MTHIEEMTKIKVEGKYILRRHADAATEKQTHNKKKSKRLNALLLQIVLKIISNALNKIFNLEFFYKTLSDISGEWGKNPEEGE